MNITEILHNLDCDITFQHLGSLDEPVNCFPINATIQQDIIVLESSSCTTGPEVTLREKGSWQVAFMLHNKNVCSYYFDVVVQEK